MAKEDAPLALPTTLTYAAEVRTVTSGQSLEIGPADLVFLQSMTPGVGKPPTMTFVVLRRTSPE